MANFYSSPNLNNLPITNPALFTEDEINSLFTDLATPEELEKYRGLIVDSIVSQAFCFSSFKTTEEINKAKAEANAFASDLFAKVNTMSISYVTSLPTEGNSSIIYVLEKTLDDGSVVHLINLWNSETSSYVETGSLESALNDVVTNDSLAKKLEDYALKTEVIKTDDLTTTIDKDNPSNAKVPTEKSVVDYIDAIPTGGVSIVSMSYADYQLLSEDEKNDPNVVYDIPDYPSGDITALDSRLTAVEEETVNCSWHTKDISLSSNLTAWGNETITVSEIINSKKVMLYDGTNQSWTPVFENIGEVIGMIYTNGLGVTDGYNFSQKIHIDFTNGNVMNISMRTLTSTGNPPNFTKIAYYK